MKPERYRQIDEVFQAALERDLSERAAFLDGVGSDDPALRREVEALLASDERAQSFIERPAFEAAPELLIPGRGGVAVGQTIGHYRIVSLLGTGGMGEVYLAEDARLGRKIALKLLPAYLTSDETQLARFEREARAASALNHPNILTVHEVGEDAGRHFIAAEFVEGETLRERMRRSRMKIGEAINVATQVASALAVAHESGIVHRDVKPENIMLRPDGFVKVLDFGLAKLTENFSARPSVAPEPSTLIETDPGIIMGTVSYMSPEQVRGLFVDARTDIFSLGVVICEMVSGRRPFEGTTTSDIIAAILERRPVPLSRTVPEAPTELGRIVEKALAKDSDERYQTIKDIEIDLRRLKRRLEVEAEIERSASPEAGGAGATRSGQSAVASAQEQTAARAGRAGAVAPALSVDYAVTEIKRHKKGAALIGVLLIVALSGVGYGLYKLTSQNQLGSAAPFRTMRVTRLTTSGKIYHAAISPDGKYVTYILRDAGQESLWLKQVATGGTMQIGNTQPIDHYNAATFSHDGNYIYYVGQCGFYQIPVIGGTPRKLLTGVCSRRFAISPDNKRLAFTEDLAGGELAIMLMGLDGTGKQKFISRISPDFFGEMSWSPDGKAIACSVYDSSGSYWNVVELLVESGAASPITSRKWFDLGGVAWLSDGTGLVIAAADERGGRSQIWHLSYPGGEARQITNDLSSYNYVSVATDSKALITVQHERQANIWLVPDAAAGRAIQITSSSKHVYNSAIGWTPQGRIVYSSNEGGELGIWIMDADGRNRRQLNAKTGTMLWPSICPDGRYIVFGSDRAGSHHIWRMDIDGANVKQLTSGDGGFPSCSPDSKWVVYISHASGQTVWKVPIDGGSPVQLTDKHSISPMISPDGRFVVCYYYDGKSYVIAFIPLQGGPPTKKTSTSQAVGNSRLTPAGRAIAYVPHSDGKNIWIQPLDGGPHKQLTDFKSEQIFNFDWSPGGKQLALTRGTETNDVVLINDLR